MDGNFVHYLEWLLFRPRFAAEKLTTRKKRAMILEENWIKEESSWQKPKKSESR